MDRGHWQGHNRFIATPARSGTRSTSPFTDDKPRLNCRRFFRLILTDNCTKLHDLQSIVVAWLFSECEECLRPGKRQWGSWQRKWMGKKGRAWGEGAWVGVLRWDKMILGVLGINRERKNGRTVQGMPYLLVRHTLLFYAFPSPTLPSHRISYRCPTNYLILWNWSF